MSHGRANPFDLLEPPRGGLAGLRARLERERGKGSRTRRRWAMAAATALPVVFAVGILLFSLQPQEPLPERFQFARMVAGLAPPPSEPLSIAANRQHLVAAQRVPSASANVVFYLVASIESPSEP